MRVGTLDFQIAKISERPEARRGRPSKVKIDVPYPVWDLPRLAHLSQSTRVSPMNRQRYENQLNAFFKYYEELENGFVVFGENFVQGIVSNLSRPPTLRQFMSDVLKELSGAKSV